MPRLAVYLATRAFNSLRSKGLVETLRRSWRARSYIRHEREILADFAKPADSKFDRMFGVDTAGHISLSTLKIKSRNWVHGNHYTPSSPQIFLESINQIKVDHKEFVFIDCGSGKGRVLLMASDYPFQQVLGIEFSPELHAIALENIHRYQSPARKCTHVDSVCADFTTFGFPSEPSVFYLFNPCAEAALLGFAASVDLSFQAHPREMIVIYANPKFADVFSRNGFENLIFVPGRYAIYRRRPSMAS